MQAIFPLQIRSSKVHFLIFIILFFFSPVNGVENNINLITYKFGGLERDFCILEKELIGLGYQVNYVNVYEKTPAPFAKINVFLETVDAYFFPFAEQNYLIPNPEWYRYDGDLIPKFDKILCKTKEAVKIFLPLNSDVFYISFTSDDCLREEFKKNYKQAIHIAGRSLQKGTASVLNLWLHHSDFPMLIVSQCDYTNGCFNRSNIHHITGYISQEDRIYLQNCSGLHLCPSETEGFGHYIFEAMSCEAVVVTTNAPPMNEVIKDSRCLLNYDRVGTQNLATTYFVDLGQFEKTLINILKMPESELRAIGRHNRKLYLKNDQFFKKKIREVFKF